MYKKDKKYGKKIVGGVWLGAFLLVFVLSSVRVTAFAKNRKDTRYMKDKIIYQQKKNGTLSVCGFKKGITFARIASSVNGRKVASINWGAFYKCKTLTRVSIPSSVKNIGGDAFYCCKKLKKAKISNRVKRIGRFAFGGCRSLGRINLPAHLKIIDSCIFTDCTALTGIEIPQGVVYISHDAFSGCTELTHIDVDKNNALYSSQKGVLFNKEKTRLICYPIGKKQSSYAVPKEVQSIGSQAFKQCSRLRSIIISRNVNTVGAFSFDCCTALAKVTIENGVKTIDGFAFSGCRSLKQITIPKSVAAIGHTIFSGCDKNLRITYAGPQKSVRWF